MNKIKLIHGTVDTVNRSEIPLSNETIEDDIDLDVLLKTFSGFQVYVRDKESCPYNQGNWIIDFFTLDNPDFPGFSFKLPACMKQEEVMKWIKPLEEKIKNKYN
jgi:hypothetical protein